VSYDIDIEIVSPFSPPALDLSQANACGSLLAAIIFCGPGFGADSVL
jgi:hypothetical protein